MSKPRITLEDRFDLSHDQVLLNGTQALVRLMLMQKARDAQAGLNTAGYCTGYRGSPLGAVDMQMRRAGRLLVANDIRFEEGLNEDLAATALWGAQQAGLRGEGRFDGVFGLWYGKGPGVDRSGDVMRHANMAGTALNGGVLMAMGDDHTGESSTVLHQSEWALVDASMPIVSPAGVQEVLDYGLYGLALSRFAGVWVGLKTMKDTIEATAVVDGRPGRMSFTTPDFPMPEGGLNIRLMDTPHAQEERMISHKRFAAEAFARANRIDRRIWGRAGATIGVVAAGKNWLDLQHALTLLGLSEAECARLGITTYKVGQVFPLDIKGFEDWAEGLDLIVIVEEKRKLIEIQVKEALFDNRRGRRVYGWYKGGMGGPGREELFPVRGALNPAHIARKLGEILIEEGRSSEEIKTGLAQVIEASRADNAEDIASRTPYFCAGCPHNSSTRIPGGSRAYAGIGCHYLVQWMDRSTLGFTHMGGEGANWIGEAPFSTREHVFQNIGDGTYNHSGIQAIRAAVASNTTMTYKILYNDAVAMTGGQGNDGGLTPARIAAELSAMGIEHLFVIHDEKEPLRRDDYPSNAQIHPRADLESVQERCTKIKGVSAIVYIQTCAAEKRRRRKRGTFPDPDQRIFINTDICEGCGDCGIQSNCVAIVPVETELGRKRAIDQSACNKDFSCLKGFCPSFVTLKGAQIRKQKGRALDLPDLPDPNLPVISGTWNVVITGVGGTGVVTLGAVLAQAAQIDGKGAGMMEMAGLAQKGGAVHIHLRLAEKPDDINAVRVSLGEADALIGGDLVVSSGARTLGLTRTGRTGAVINSHEIITGDFVRDANFYIPSNRLQLTLKAKLQEDVSFTDAHSLAQTLLGDSIYANMVILGAAWQNGLLPLSLHAIEEAIRLNGAAVDGNLRAFAIGRFSMVDPEKASAACALSNHRNTLSLKDKIEYRANHLRTYQGEKLAQRYLARLNEIKDEELLEIVATSYHKLLSYKDEYEIARLALQSRSKAAEVFEGNFTLSYHLAPPFFSRQGPDGRPEKRRFGGWIVPAFAVLAKMKALRGTVLDPFGHSQERREERALIRRYEADLDRWLTKPGADRETLKALARWPQSIRGFGPVKQTAIKEASKQREALTDKLGKAK